MSSYLLILLVLVPLASCDDTACCKSDTFYAINNFTTSGIVGRNNVTFKVSGKTSVIADIPQRKLSAVVTVNFSYSSRNGTTKIVSGIDGSQKLGYANITYKGWKNGDNGWEQTNFHQCWYMRFSNMTQIDQYKCLPRMYLHAVSTENGQIVMEPDQDQPFPIPYPISYDLQLKFNENTCILDLLHLTVERGAKNGEAQFTLLGKSKVDITNELTEPTVPANVLTECVQYPFPVGIPKPEDAIAMARDAIKGRISGGRRQH